MSVHTETTAPNRAERSAAAVGSGTFGSLRSPNFRLMAAGYLVSNTCYWMGYTAQS